jgi:hypothetical protein
MAVTGTGALQDADRGAGSDRRVTARRRRLGAVVALTALAGFLVGEQAALPAGAVEVQAVIGPEHPVAPTVVDGPGAARDPASAFDGTNYLVVWNGLGGIRAARVAQSGALLDPRPIFVSSGTGSLPDVTFDGTNYLVVWSTNDVNADIRGARISTDGVVLDPESFPIETGPRNDRTPVVASDGTSSLVLWLAPPAGGFPDPWTVSGTRVDTGGNVIDPAPRVIPEAQTAPSIAFDGDNYLILWAAGEPEPAGIRAIQMTPDGTVLAPGIIQVSTDDNVSSATGAVFDGVRWQVAWSRFTPEGQDVRGARVSRTGSVLDPAGITIAAGPGDQTDVSIARNGTNVLVAWTDSRQEGDVYAARVSRLGVVLDPAGIALATGPGPHEMPALVDGMYHVLATFVGRSGDRCCSVQAVRVNRAGAVVDPAPRLVSQQSNSQVGPKTAFDGTNHLVVWEDDRGDGSDGSEVYAARVTPDGESLDPAGFRIGDSTPGTFTDVAFDGTNYVIVWDRFPPQGGPDVFGALVSPGGVLLTPDPIPIAVSPDRFAARPRLSPNGTNTMVVWWSGSGIVATRLSRSGQVLDPGGIEISDPAVLATAPSIAFDGTNHLIAYTTAAPVGENVMARRISPDGTLLDPAALPIALAGPDEFFVVPFTDVAWSGSCYLVVWTGQKFFPDEGWVDAARVGTDGTVLAPGVVRLSRTNEVEQESPSVAALNGWFLVVWTRREPFGSVVAGARVHENGSAPDRSELGISDSGSSPDVATGGDGRWRTVYHRNVGPPTAADRVFLRTVAPK